MNASIRTVVALAMAAVCPASFVVHLWLFYAYFSSHPTSPNNARGLVHALNNHGSYVYISDTESTGLALLGNVFLLGLFGAFAMFPKDPTLAPPGTARWLAHFYVARKDFDNPRPRLKVIFFCFLVFYFAVICFAGPSIVHFVVSRGIVLLG